MSGLDLFVTKSYDKTPAKQRSKKVAMEKKMSGMSKAKPKTKNIGYTAGDGAGKMTKGMAAKSKSDAAKKESRTEAAKQLGLLTQTMADRKNAEAKKKMQAIKGRRAAAATPSGRGASGAATKKTKPGTVTRGKSNFVLDNMRRAAGRG